MKTQKKEATKEVKTTRSTEKTTLRMYWNWKNEWATGERVSDNSSTV